MIVPGGGVAASAAYGRHLGYTWTMRADDIARRRPRHEVSVDPITTGTMSFLRQIRENPAMARLQTTPTGLKWVRKVFKDVVSLPWMPTLCP